MTGHKRHNTELREGEVHRQESSREESRSNKRPHSRRQPRSQRKPHSHRASASHKEPLYRSFGYAFQGIRTCISSERNMKIHCLAAAMVIVFGIWLKLSVTEWCICLVLFGLIMGLEMVNTAVESVVDLVTEERKPLAKKAKDTAAGAVLIAAIMAAIVGCVIFLPKLWRVFFG